MLATLALAVSFACNSTAQADSPSKDMRAELPRDVRIVLLGVPSVKSARNAETHLRNSIALLQDELAKKSPVRTKLEQARAAVYFRLGQFDNALLTLRDALHDQERVKGLEEYGEFARAIELHSESLAALTGTSEAPTISEDGDGPAPAQTSSDPAEFAKQLDRELAAIDRLLDKIDQKSKPDAERKAQLEKDVGSLGQFVFQIRNLTEDIKAAEAGEGTVRVDTGEIVRGVQGLIDVIRDIKRERELKNPPPREREPRSIRRDRTKL